MQKNTTLAGALFAILTLLFSLPASAGALSCPADSARYAVVNVSVCNVRGEGRFTSGMETQALLGTPVRVMQYDGWYHIQTPDEYTGWVHRMVITPMTATQLSEWNAADKVVVTALCGQTFTRPDEKSQSVSDVVAGCRLKLTGKHGRYYSVEYPDGRRAYISKRIAMPLTSWRAGVSVEPDDIVKSAFSLMGVPYLWAGMSTKGVDCSGFVRTVLFMHDVIMPRDAWQQALIGERIVIAPDYSNLQPADLVFFGTPARGEQKEHVSHVGIYIGGGRFIHSLGDVHVGSFLPADSLYYDAFNTARLLYGGRVLPYINNVKEMTTTQTNAYYTK
jgi:SH3-like domain-containing protein